MPRRSLAREQKKDVRDTTRDNVIGFVTKVHEHDGDEQRFTNHQVNVQLVHQQEELKRVPVHADHEGSIYVPQKGDAVEVAFLQSRTQRPVVANFVYTDDNRAPLGRAGHWRRRFDDVSGQSIWLEAEPKDHSAGEPDTLRMAVKKDGLSNPSMAIEIDESGSDTVASIRKNGDPDSDQISELEIGIDEGGNQPSAYIAADADDDGTDEALIEILEDGSISITNNISTDISIDHNGDGSIAINNGTNGNITITDSVGDITIESGNGNAKVKAPTATAQLDGSSVKLGSGGTGVIKDVSPNLTKDADGHVTDVTLDITRSSVVSTQ